MTDNEIVKALECCKSGTTDDCSRCPRLDDDRTPSTEDCMEKLMHDALALINRQKETIEQLQTALFKCGEDAVEIENYKKIAEHQQSLSMDRFFEIQRLKEEIVKLEAETDRLNYILQCYALEHGTAVDKERFLKPARAEAVKEFAESLKTNVFEVDDINGDTVLAVEVSHIDYLVKEFTEGENT